MECFRALVSQIACLALVSLFFVSVGCSDSEVGAGAESGDNTESSNEITETPQDYGDESNVPDPEGGTEDPNQTLCASDDDCQWVFELNPCQRSICDSATGYCAIEVLEDGSECADGEKCTGPDYCLNGECGGGPKSCDDENVCTLDECDSKVGCVHSPVEDMSCDDGDACTEEDFCVDGACQSGAKVEGCCIHDGECEDDDLCTDEDCNNGLCEISFNYAPCNDGDPCTLKDHCDGSGACFGDELMCEDGNPCTLDLCNPENGTCESSAAADGTPCEDGNPCTSPDACVGGLCEGQGNLCQCTTDADCVSFEDDNLCNGTLKCLDFVCVVNPITVVICNPTGDTQCVQNTCDPETAQCVPVAAINGTGCDDQNTCTSDDICTNGLCVGDPASCDDGNICTYDACSPISGCTYIANTLACDDGNACTANDLCANETCSGESIICSDGNGCTDDDCSPESGCQFTPNSLPCDDGNGCTESDLCVEGECIPGQNTCACVTDGDCVGEEDGNLCNGTLKCIDNQCAVDPTTVVECNTVGDTACQVTGCQPSTGLCLITPVMAGTPCNDQNACTVSDACDEGVCTGNPVTCDDSNFCTDDACSLTEGCVFSDNVKLCDDGDLCTAADKCSGGFCLGSAIVCDDGNPCSVNYCEQDVGCTGQPAMNGVPCDDGNVCTIFDGCEEGLCQGEPIDCDDGNFCTADTCSHPGGCANTNVADGTPCDDGSACSNADQCVKGNCVGNPPSCDDSDPCTIDTCDDDVGCIYESAPNGTACTDGDPCTAPDACISGLCLPGDSICGCETDADCLVEEDGDICNGTLVCQSDGTCKVDPATVIICDQPENICEVSICVSSKGGCQIVAAQNGLPCGEENGCLLNPTCQNGLCEGFLATCDDGNPCTVDSCFDDQCQYQSAFDGQGCESDNNPCTLDICSDGVCSHPNVADGLACGLESNECSVGMCEKGSCVETPTNEGLPCTDDGNECTYDQCANGVCQHINNDPPPVDENQCFPVAELTADAGPVTGSWSDCGVADQFDFKCKGNNCTNTGAIDSWPCADPNFVYDGEDTGYEYAYVFVAPSDGTCTFIEYAEGINLPGSGNNKFPVIDWFILSGGGCDANSCIAYVWENVQGLSICGGGNKVCSYKEFAVTEGQVFYIVADIFDGVNNNTGYGYEDTWDIEIVCDATEQLLLNEDFTDAVCDGCSSGTNAPPQCQDFDWHSIGGFGDVTTGYYLGQMQGGTLLGYDCGATSSTLSFPTVSLPNNATSCTVSFDYYAELDPADDGDCTNDILEVKVVSGGGQAQTVSGSNCSQNNGDSNPIGSSSSPTSSTYSYDITSYAGSDFTLQLGWSADGNSNAGLGVIIDNVQISCTVP